MILQKVTITGADDYTDLVKLKNLTLEFPFVEWGLLLSKDKVKNKRYPSNEFLLEITDMLSADDSFVDIPTNRYSLHLCGSIAREVLTGMTPVSFHSVYSERILLFCDRVQLNFTKKYIKDWNPKEVKVGLSKLFESRFEMVSYNFPVGIITQIKNDHEDLWAEFLDAEISPITTPFTHHLLFDQSGGHGVLAKKWKPPIPGFFCGYAGGLKPENIVEELNKIEEVVGNGVCFIDLETGVRNQNDDFDLDKVREILEACEPYTKFKRKTFKTKNIF